MRNIITKVAVAGLLLVPQTMQAKSEHLLPRPQEITLTAQGSAFALGGTVSIIDPTGCKALQEFFTSVGCTIGEGGAPVTVTLGAVDGSYDFELAGFPNEAYSLEITADAINIVAVTPTGVIRAAQTLSQLAQGYEGTAELEALTIKDWPAFKLRGFMHDVGRSFMSVDQLKRQIDALAKFKVNTFHWHFTENQAWRFEVKAYPQLTSAASMTRFAGQYYTQDEVKEVQDYAYERGMVIIPEIDMPGHSAAFTRAMGHDMQTDEGVAELKVIIKEVCELFDKVEYVHIGGDEVTITYPDFLETMIAEVKKYNKKVAVWNPINGVNVSNLDADMTQMWSSRGARIDGKANIDCRYNYTNHFDVFADLVGIYRSNIYYQAQGTAEVPGFLSCPWNDRKTPTEDDIIRQNNFYANVIASTERAWIGGGEGYIETLGTMLPNTGEGYEEFADWERRFLFHKATTLSAEADLIPYVKQANVRWRITDPFPNGGNSATVFAPEEQGTAAGTEMMDETFTHEGETYYTGMATGAGIYLRHTWDNSTMPTFYGSTNYSNVTSYAWTYVYSPVEQTVGAQIEFHNYGRSENDKAPDAGKWDRKGSDIWINGERIAPPTWGNSGKSIGSEVDLLNENFTARTPLQVTLKQGWNKVFLKLPYVDADGIRLKKWMFTCVFTDTEGKNAVDGLIYSPNQCMDEVTEKVAAEVSAKKRDMGQYVGTGVGKWPESAAQALNSKIAEIEATYQTEMTEAERDQQVAQLEDAWTTFRNSLTQENMNQPEEGKYYRMHTPLRGSRYPTSSGIDQAIVGETSHDTYASVWKFVAREDGSYDIQNFYDLTYISPASANNTALRTVSAQPSAGWTLKKADTVGYVVIVSGTAQFNQTNNSNLGFNVYNWGGGTNTDDTGCQYLVEEVTVNPEDEGSGVIPEGETPTTITYTIDKANGSTYRSGTAGTQWSSEWKSTSTPQLVFSTSKNNMQWNSAGAGNYLNLASGGSSSTFTFTPPTGYVITGYSYTIVNEGHTTGITISNSDTGTAYTTSGEEQTVSATGKALSTMSITVAGANKMVTFKNFTVTVSKDDLPEPEGPAISTAGDEHWYYITSAATNDYCANKVIYYDADQQKLRFNTKTFNAAYLWSFWEQDGKLAIKNYNGEYFGTAPSGTGGSTAFGVVSEPNYIYTISSAYGAFIIKDTGTELHAQEASSLIVRWAASANGASLWKFDEVDVSNPQAAISSVVVEQGKVTTGIGNKDQGILRVTIDVAGLTGTCRIDSLDVWYTGTSAADATRAKAYLASNSRELFVDADNQMPWREENAELLADTALNGQRLAILKMDREFAPGKYYLWIAYDISETATEGNLADARLRKIFTPDSTFSYSISQGNPANGATIFLSEGTVLISGDMGSTYYRIPSITVTKDGTRLVTLTDDRKNHNTDLPAHCYLVAQYSDDLGKTWSEPQTVAGTATTGGNYGHGDASIVTNRDNGDIVGIMTSSPHGNGFFAGTADAPPHWKTIVSHDNGLTWEAPVDHTSTLYGSNCTNAKTKTWKAGFSGSGAALQLRDGTLVSSFVNRQSDNSQHFYFFMSDDGGQNWYVKGTSGTSAADEPKTLERNNGDLAISVRASGYNYHNVTSDRGETWKKASQTRFTTGISGNACDGEYMVWCSTVEGNPWDIAFQTLPNSGSRQNVSIALSTDEGETFGTPKTICPRGSAYSATTVLPDGTLGIYYEENSLSTGYTMRFVRCSLDWASGGTYKFTEDNPFKPIKSTVETGINDVLNGSTEKADNTIYDLQGRRVVTPTKAGVYIQNGKKVFMK